MEYRYSRNDLYELIWSRPIKDIAPQFEISDVALAKVCRRYDIPLPGRGHWAKLKAGHKVAKVSLPPRTLGMSDTIHLGRDDWHQREENNARLMSEEIAPPPEFPETFEELMGRVTKLVGKVTLCKDLSSPHKDIARLLQDDVARLEKSKAATYPSFFDQPYFHSPFERRRLRILNSIFLALSRLDMLPSLHGKNPSDFSVRVGSSSITVQLDQPKHKHVRDDNWRQVSDTRRPASDLLRVSIHWHAEKVEGLRLVWEDRADATIEQSLQEIVISLIVAGEMQIRIEEIQQHRWRVEQKARLIEDERKRDEEARRKEHEKRKRFEQACIDHLLESAVALRMANDLRAYVQAVEKCNASSTDPLSATEMNEWRIWALAQADRIDPLLSRAFLKIVEEPVETEQIKPLEKHHGLPPLLTAETIKPQWHPNHWYAQLYRK